MTARTQHTPGPWRLGVFAVFAGERTIVANMASRPASTDLPEALERVANGELIAAAPDLLAALKDAVPLLIRLGDFIGNGEDGSRGCMERCDAILAARAAIARAEGRDKP